MREAMRRIWAQFEGQDNTQTVLEQKAQSLAKLLIAIANHSVTAFIESADQANPGPTISEEDKVSLSLEFLYIGIHCADRMASSSLTDEKKAPFFNTLIQAVLLQLCDMFSESASSKEDISTLLQEQYNERTNYYCQFHFSLNEAVSIDSEDLAWVFGEAVTAMLGSDEIAVIKRLSEGMRTAMKALQLEDLFNGTIISTAAAGESNEIH